ncbi:XK-related protein 5 [Bagarius yarrelli]|uniref:XK-related protein n=1 Tax=Bagarius yarrelli TaxID=175774 RepID=A0A556U8U7_BAGYA|nr:XK-related protein 5 [Bagarius yarrelli]
MQQVDVAALRLLDVLLLTLPQALTHTYVLTEAEFSLTSPGKWAWRSFNLVFGGVHIFLFLNVKDGPSRYRMAGFYTVMLLENVTLVLAASDILTDASWESLTVPTAVLCSFLLEISHTVHHGAQAGSACLDQVDSSYSLADKSLALPSLRPPLSSSHPSFSLLEHSGSCGAKAGTECRHHHWLLVRLALKTGDPVKIERSFGAGGVTGIASEEQDDNSQEKSEGEEGREDGMYARDEDDTLAPLSDCKDEFESVSEARDDVEEEDMGEEMDSVDSEWKRSSPEGKSVFGDSSEPDYCPTESSSTLYFSADPQSPSSASDPRLDRVEVSGPLLTGPRRHVFLSARGLEDDKGF